MKLSIIIPCKNKSGNILDLYKKISDSLNKIRYELIFIDDGSDDDTLEELHKLYESDVQHVKVLSLSKNFKKEAAIIAGLNYATGEYTCILNGSIEYDTNYIDEMYNLLEESNEYDCVGITYKEEKMSFINRVCFNIINNYCKLDIGKTLSKLRMFRKNVKEAILDLSEKNSNLDMMFAWVGFNTKLIECKEDEVEYKIDKNKLLECTKNAVFACSDKVLTISYRLGFTTILASLIYLIVTLVLVCGLGYEMNAVYALIVIMLLLFGLQFVIIGFVGSYLSTINNAVQGRPKYIVKEKLGFGNETIL